MLGLPPELHLLILLPSTHLLDLQITIRAFSSSDAVFQENQKTISRSMLLNSISKHREGNIKELGSDSEEEWLKMGKWANAACGVLRRTCNVFDGVMTK